MAVAETEWLEPAPEPVVEPAQTDGRALRVMQCGAIAVVLAASAYRTFELDRFFVPKELTLHLTALIAGVLLLRAMSRVLFTLVDVLLVVVLLLGAVSALTATNGWLGVRALAVTASGVTLFWAARCLRAAGREAPLLGAIAVAIVIGCATSLLQAYGVRTDFFSINRAPGGTLGNRNFIAHMAAFGLPVIVLVALRATHWARYTIAVLGAAIVTAALIMTRSRAGFLAFAAVIVIFCAAPLFSFPLRSHRATWLKFAGIVVVAVAGIAAAVLLPNELRWRSENPYLESITGVANFQEGSGRGRLVQYQRSMVMALHHPLLGVGPGNWPVEYPGHAARRDPSLDGREAGTTSNPWPSSDWVAFIAERGFAAALILGLALLGMALRALTRLAAARDVNDALAATTLLATLLAAGVAGTFDAVLLLALPTLLVWTTLGVLWTPAERKLEALPALLRTATLVGTIFITAVGAVRSTAQLVAMGIYENADSAAWLSRAAWIDPGNYRLRVRLARSSSGLPREARCRHARAAHDLLPRAQTARSLTRNCR